MKGGEELVYNQSELFLLFLCILYPSINKWNDVFKQYLQKQQQQEN